MSSQVSRRTLIELLGAAAIGTAGYEIALHNALSVAAPVPGTPVAGTTPYRVNLICYGMIGYWCVPPTLAAPGSITILIPISPPETNCDHQPDGNPAHIVRLSEFIGGLPNRLAAPRGSYSLEFGGATATPSFLGISSLVGSNLVLYDFVNKSNHGLGISDPGVALRITVPYPTSVRTYRRMDFGSVLPYVPGNTVATFGLTAQNLHVLSGVNVLTYDFPVAPDHVPVPVSVALTLNGVPYTFQANVAPNLLNLHLYSQPATINGYNDAHNHIDYFDKLFTYTGANRLDLSGIPMAPGVHYPPVEPTDDDLSALDIKSLSELPWSDTGTPCRTSRLGDPAECVQGWGS